MLAKSYNKYLVKYSIYSFTLSELHSLHKTGKKEMFYLTMHLTHFIYGYMASDAVNES